MNKSFNQVIIILSDRASKHKAKLIKQRKNKLQIYFISTNLSQNLIRQVDRKAVRTQKTASTTGQLTG